MRLIKSGSFLVFALLTALGLRLLVTGLYPLMDTTEARYGEVVRIMLELNDWVTPWFDYDDPFWGKPPLAFWASAIGGKLLGLSEFALRLPQWILSCLVMINLWYLASQRSHREALWAVAILAGGWMFFATSALIMTDMGLTLGITMAMVGFWRSLQSEKFAITNFDQLLLFSGLAIAILAKGPVSLALAITPIFLWCLWQRRLVEVISKFPWFFGGLLVTALTLPWFIWAELRTPGFLHYFVFEEHINRFFFPDIQDARFGSPHLEPKGKIWAFYAAAVLPWLIIFPMLWLTDKMKRQPAKPIENEGWASYLLLFALTPGLLFTFSGSILPAYVLPGLPAAAMLMAIWLGARQRDQQNNLLVSAGVLSTVLVFAILFYVNASSGDFDRRSTKALHADHAALSNGDPIFYFGNIPFSARFYSQGQAQRIEDPDIFPEVEDARPIWIAYPKSQPIPEGFESHFRLISEYPRFNLWKQISVTNATHHQTNSTTPVH